MTIWKDMVALLIPVLASDSVLRRSWPVNGERIRYARSADSSTRSRLSTVGRIWASRAGANHVSTRTGLGLL